jgi:hypothetical protein
LERDGEPFARFDVHGAYHSSYSAAVFWKQWVVIGFSCYLYLFSLENDQIILRPLNHLFTFLYPTQDVLLVASEGKLLCVDAQGDLRWHVALDYAIIDRIEENIIYGTDGWDERPFALSLDSGHTVG